MNNHNKPWTKKEDEKLMKEYKEKGRHVLAREMGRTAEALTYRYYVVRNKLNKHYQKEFKKADKCPFCGGGRINEVVTYNSRNCIPANYCLTCLHEFTSDGEIIPPLWHVEDI